MPETRPAASRRLPIILAVGAACLLIAALVIVLTQPKPQTDGSERAATGLTIKAQQGSAALDINRVTPASSQPASIAKDSWTILVYLCGSDLESQSAAATTDINEMLKGTQNNNIRYVVETGGARSWKNNIMRSNQLGRYVIENGQISDAGAVSAATMGDARTLAEFINWGVRAYPADHMALILWDHGGGSISGVCFDELNRRDSLYLRELDTALNAGFATMWEKFEFIGFDACLMSTLETANVCASYADYMVASQESEPGGGWEYASITRWLAQNPASTGAELGRAICDTYLASVQRNMKGFVTLSVTDLSKIDQLMQDYSAFSKEMYESGSDQSKLAQMTRAINQAENYGCNNRREGFTNMVDLGGIVDACSAVAPSASTVKKSLADAIVYQINGTYHAGATGLSTYYPLAINDKTELSIFETVAVNPSYLSYVDRLAHGATYNGGSQYQQYSSDSVWQGNFWEWLIGNALGVQEQTEPHWSYVDEHTEESTQIGFADEPQIDEEGTLWFRFDAASLDRAAVVSGMVYERGDNGTDLIALGETFDVYGDWTTGQFADGFDGRWLSLPDGQALDLTVDAATENHVVYVAPIELNGEECYLRLCQNLSDGSVVIEGAWNAVDESGAMDRTIVDVKRGDKIVPLYRAVSTVENVKPKDYEGDEYTVATDELEVAYVALPEGRYLYSFCIQDVFGDVTYTPSAEFEVDADGTIYF